MALGDNVRLQRKTKKLTQKQLAAILNVDTSTITKIELNQALPSVTLLVSMAKFFDVSTDYLLELKDID